MTTLAFTVLGRPQPAGSKRAFPHAKTGRMMVVDAAKGAGEWKQQVASVARQKTNGTMFDGPVGLDVLFVMRRPRAHFGTGKNSGTVKVGAPAQPIVRPDTTKLLRCVEDALTGIIWRDDAQVVEQRAVKCYGEPERCEVLVIALPRTVGAAP